MGVQQSLHSRRQTSSPRKGHSLQSSPAPTRDQSNSSAETASTTSTMDATTTSKNKQTTTASYQDHMSSPTASIHSQVTATTPSTVQDSPYPFREKVKHLPPAARKEKYEEEIYRLFQSPHPTHLERLAPVKIQTEKADLPLHKRNTVVTWSETQLTYDIGKGALIQRSYKRCNRSKADPWRRYGALRKLHEIGGTGCTPPNQGSRAPQKFYRIEPGSIPPPPPG